MARPYIIRSIRICKECGALGITGTKLCAGCSKSKRQQWMKSHRSGTSRWDSLKLTRIVCCICFGTVDRKSGAGRDAGLCCSRKCGFELIRRRGAASRAITYEKKLYAKWSRQAKAMPKAAPAKQAKQCRECEIEIARGKQRCVPCKEVATFLAKRTDAALANKRASKAKRAAIKRGVEADRFDPIEIFHRDGWRCYICGCHTPKVLRGTYAPNAPELDHVIALAQGGQHTRSNTACSCRRCNGLKSDRPLEDVRQAA